MKKKYLQLLLVLLPALLFVFFFYSAQKGILLFSDSLRDDAESMANETRHAVLRAIGNAHGILARMAASGDIRHALVQFGMGESLEKAQFYLRQEAGRLEHCARLRLVSLDGKIAIDTVEPSLEGKPLLPEELARHGAPSLEKEGYSFLPTGEMVCRIPAREAGGLVTGSIYAVFRRDFFTTLHRPVGDPVKNHAFLFSDDVIFFNLPRSIGDAAKISRIALHLRRTLDPYYEDSVVVFPSRESGFPFVFAYGIDRDQVGLPAFARWILLINGFVVFASLLVIVLHNRAGKQEAELRQFRTEIDAIGSGINETAATADRIIVETESLYHQAEKVSRDLSVAAQARPVLSAPAPEPATAPPRDEEEAISLDAILSRKAEGAGGGFVDKVKDEELQDLIDMVAAQDKEETMISATGSGILGATGIGQYWENMLPLLNKSLGLSVFMLLEPDADGVFRVTRSEGIDGAMCADFTLSVTEPLYTLFPGSRKVLFLKDSVLQNSILGKKFPGLSPDFFTQFAMVPVIRGEEVSGILVLGAAGADAPLDVFTLHEVMYLSIL